MKRLIQIIFREWKRICTIPHYYIVLLVLPPVVFLFYGLIYHKEYARELPVAIWDEDQSAITRKLSDMMDHTESVHIVTQVHSEKEIEKLFRQGKVFAAVHFPSRLESDIKSNHTASVTLYTNSAALVPSKLIYKDAAGVIIKAGLAVVLQKAERSGKPAGEAMALVQPVKLNTHTLYNPSFNYKEYLVPGLITVGVQMALIIASVLILNLEFTGDTAGSLFRISQSASQIILGKVLAHLSVSWLNFILIWYILFPLMGLEKPGTGSAVFILYTMLSLACIGIGMLVSALSENLLFCADLALFYTAPAFVFSGYTFPRFAMPWYDQFYAGAMPYTYFLDGFIRTYYMELPLSYVTKELAAMSLFFAVSILLAIPIFQRKISRYLSRTASVQSDNNTLQNT